MYAPNQGARDLSADTEVITNGKPRVVCVLGMHRSGTSLTARLLNFLGVYLGPEKDLRSRSDENPLGYWEQRTLVDVNDAILAKLGGTWSDLPEFFEGWEKAPRFADLRQKALEFIEQNFTGSSLWGWKDPRTSMTLPFWQNLLPPMLFVICLRNPLDVASSIERRSVSFDHSIKLWSSYVSSALERTSGHPRLLVSYEDTIENWPAQFNRLAQFLGLSANAEDPGLRGSAGEFIDRRLQHYRTTLSALADDSRLEISVKALYMALRLESAIVQVVDTGNVGTRFLKREDLDIMGRFAVRAEAEADLMGSEIDRAGAAVAEGNRRLKELSDKLALAEAEVERVTSSLGWRILSSYGPIKYRFVLPVYRSACRLFGRGQAARL